MLFTSRFRKKKRFRKNESIFNIVRSNTVCVCDIAFFFFHLSPSLRAKFYHRWLYWSESIDFCLACHFYCCCWCHLCECYDEDVNYEESYCGNSSLRAADHRLKQSQRNLDKTWTIKNLWPIKVAIKLKIVISCIL